MAENPIKNTDFYDGNGKPFEDVVKNILELEATYDRLTQKIKTGVATLKQLSSAVDSKGIKEQADVTKQLEINTAELVKTEQQLVKEKIEAQKLIKLQLQLDKETKANQDKLAKSTEQQTSAYKEQSKTLNKLRNDYKDLAVAGKQNTDEAKALKRQIDALDKSLKDVDKSVGQNQRNVGNYGDALKGLGTKLTGLLGIVGGATVIWEGFKKVMNSTAAGADQLEFGLKAVGGALDGALQTIQNGDWQNFFDNIKNGAKAAYDLAEGLDAVDDREKALNAVQSSNLALKAKLEIAYKNENLSTSERKKNLMQLLEIEKKENEQNKQIIEEKVRLNENYVLSKTGVNKADLKSFIDIRANQPVIEKQADLLKKISEETKTIVNYNQGQMSTTKVFTDRALAAQKVISTSQKDFAQFAKTKIALESKLNTETIDMIVETYSKRGQVEAAYDAENVKRITKLNSFNADLTKKEREESEKRIAQAQKEAAEKALIASGGLKPKNLTQLADTKDIGPTKRTGFGLTDYEMRQAKATAEEAAENEIRIVQDKEKKKQALQQATFNTAKDLTESLGNIFESQKNRELAAAGDNASKKEAIERKYARREQKLAIARAVITGAESVLYASLLPPPANWISAAAQSVVVATQIAMIASQKFAKGGTWVEGGRLHSQGGNRYGDKELEKGERVSVFSRSATSKHDDLIQEFTNSINADRLDLFSLNFAPKHMIVQQTDKRLLTIAEKQLAEQKKLNDNIINMPIVSGNKIITKHSTTYVV